MPKNPILTRKLGRTGETPTVLGLGGEGVLRTFGYERQATDVIHAALDEGITYFDSARAYAGSEHYYGGALGDMRDRIFLTSKAHDRSKRGALAMLDETLQNMRTDHLDLWQLHDVRTWDELDAIGAPGGTYEAFVEAKKAGKTRFIGVTGHHDPHVLLTAIERFAFDTVLLPVNPCEAHSEPFVELVGSRAKELGMGVIAMKVFSRGLLLNIPASPTPQELLDYALSRAVDVAIIGCDSVEQVEENAAAVRRFHLMSPPRQRELESRLQPDAERMLYYRPPAMRA